MIDDAGGWCENFDHQVKDANDLLEKKIDALVDKFKNTYSKCEN